MNTIQYLERAPVAEYAPDCLGQEKHRSLRPALASGARRRAGDGGQQHRAARRRRRPPRAGRAPVAHSAYPFTATERARVRSNLIHKGPRLCGHCVDHGTEALHCGTRRASFPGQERLALARSSSLCFFPPLRFLLHSRLLYDNAVQLLLCAGRWKVCLGPSECR